MTSSGRLSSSLVHLARAAGVLAAFVALSSCTSLKQYRPTTVASANQDLAEEPCPERAPNASTDLCALERRTYTYQGEEHHYYFATVEFDDQGWFWDRRQMEVLLRFLYQHRDEAGGEPEFLILAHAHGWKHNADACDNNVVCFQRMLERLDVSGRHVVDGWNRLAGQQRPRPHRTVVGVYIGWRGRSGTVRYLDNATFYSRKAAGNRVGIGGVTELLTRLNGFRDFKNPERDSALTQLVISGHSFGGQVIYKALAPLLLERATKRDVDSDDRYRFAIANSFGDLVLLANPAFEGSAYENLQFAATNRCYLPAQRPVMLIVTSEADGATRRAFPAGRFFSNLFSNTQCRDQRKAVLHTVGHLERYTTHELKLKEIADRGRSRPEERKEGDCGCPYLAPIEEFAMADQDEQYLLTLVRTKEARMKARAATAAGPQDLVTSYGLDATDKEMVLERSPDYAANYPYLVVSTTADFIPDHNSIFGERFTAFLRRFFYTHIAAEETFPVECFEPADGQCRPTDITPCERSWTGRLHYGCDANTGNAD